MPDLFIARGGRKSDVVEVLEGQTQRNPRIGPRLGTHYPDQSFHLTGDVIVRQKSQHRSSSAGTVAAVASTGPSVPLWSLPTAGSASAAGEAVLRSARESVGPPRRVLHGDLDN